MTMFRHRQQLRRWALRVLLVWLFGLGFGVANACLAAKQFESAPDAMSVTSPASNATQDAMPEGCDHHVVASGTSHGDSQGTPGKSNCESFCERTSVSIPSQKSMLDDLQGHVMPAIALVTSLNVPVQQPALSWVPRRDGVRPRPISITFLRLAL